MGWIINELNNDSQQKTMKNKHNKMITIAKALELNDCVF
ncbi:hypothetical protein Sbal175_4423 (plasmid) [Shewanella baltica BA175]|nr:hypothetical protein Sbal175_4423 [Shewanella baltica BA175]